MQEVQGSGYLSKAADLYSLGVLLWELYHGMPPWYASAEGRLVNNQCFPRFNLRSRQDAPFSYAVLTLACLSKEHTERCASATLLHLLFSIFWTCFNFRFDGCCFSHM